MTSVERSFTVTAAPSVVLDYLSDFGNTEQWDPATRRTVRVDAGPIAPGATWLNTSEVFERTSEITYTCVSAAATRSSSSARTTR